MRYKIFCSNGYEPVSYYCDDKRQADLFFNMAVESKTFEYVELAEVAEEYFTKREWSANENEV